MLHRASVSRVLLPAALVAFVAYLPLPWGSVTPTGVLVYRLGAFSLLILGVFATPERDPRRLPMATITLVGMTLIGVAQTLPVPAAVVALVAPRTHAIYLEAASVLETAAPGWMHFSVAPRLSLSAAIDWAAIAGMFVTGAFVGRLRNGIRWLAWGLLLAAALQLAVGVRGGHTIDASAHARFQGTFVNANHQALYLSFGLAVATAFIWNALGSRRRALSGDAKLLAAGVGMAALLLLAVALVLTGSRSGWLALVACMVGQVLVVAWRRRAALVLGLAAVLVAGLALAAVVPGPLASRLVATSPFEAGIEGRLQVWRASLDLVRQFAWSGSGLGTYGDLFPSIRNEAITDLWLKAHNGPLELLITGGVAAVVLAAIGLVALLRRLWRVWSDAADRDARALALAALGALFAALVHQCFDFGLAIPANAATLAVLAGAASGARLRVAGDPATPG